MSTGAQVCCLIWHNELPFYASTVCDKIYQLNFFLWSSMHCCSSFDGIWVCLFNLANVGNVNVSFKWITWYLIPLKYMKGYFTSWQKLHQSYQSCPHFFWQVCSKTFWKFKMFSSSIIYLLDENQHFCHLVLMYTEQSVDGMAAVWGHATLKTLLLLLGCEQMGLPDMAGKL